MQEHHLLQLLSGILEWVDPPHVVAQAIESGKSERSNLVYFVFYFFILPSSSFLFLWKWSLTAILIFQFQQ